MDVEAVEEGAVGVGGRAGGDQENEIALLHDGAVAVDRGPGHGRSGIVVAVLRAHVPDESFFVWLAGMEGPGLIRRGLRIEEPCAAAKGVSVKIAQYGEGAALTQR